MLSRDIPTINAELQRSGFSVCSSVGFFCDAPAFPIWYCKIISHYPRGKTPVADNSTSILGANGGWELRATFVSSVLDEWNSIATVECIRESMGPPSVDCPLQSWACWFGRKNEQMRIAAKTGDWQFIYCSVKWFNDFVPHLNKTSACK